MAHDAQIIALGLTKPELFRASETVVFAAGVMLIIVLFVRPAVKRALETLREVALERAQHGRRPAPRRVIIDYSRLPIPKLWRHALQL